MAQHTAKQVDRDMEQPAQLALLELLESLEPLEPLEQLEQLEQLEPLEPLEQLESLEPLEPLEQLEQLARQQAEPQVQQEFAPQDTPLTLLPTIESEDDIHISKFLQNTNPR
jgi:hypothetical protein